MSLIAEFMLALEIGAQKISRRHAELRLPNLVGPLLKQGILRKAGLSSFVVCDLCEDPHSAALYFNAQYNVWRYRCVDSGQWSVAEADMVEALQLDEAQAYMSIRNALAPIEFDIRKCADGCLAGLGESRLGGAAWTVMFARALFPEVIGKLQGMGALVSSTPGLILTSTSIGERRIKIDRHNVVALDAIMSIDKAGRLKANAGAIRAALGLATPSGNKRGRPADFTGAMLEEAKRLSRDELNLSDNQIIELMFERVPGAAQKNHGTRAKSLIDNLKQAIALRRVQEDECGKYGNSGNSN